LKPHYSANICTMTCPTISFNRTVRTLWMVYIDNTIFHLTII